ncbi:MAG: GLPGLI family protein [Prevotellaceae bacterium]|nr:GLPGLI family protein [Prevotellaceae bacterium]
MKRAILTLAMALPLATISAQELTVTYQAVYNTASPGLFADAGLPEEMRAALAAAYKDVVMTYRLTLKGDESEYRVVPGEGKQEITFMGQTIDVNAAAQAQAGNYTYKNHAEGILLDKTQFFDKNFVIRDSLSSAPFTVIDSEKRQIAGFACLKALSSDGKTTAWYTPDIPVKDEPIASGLDGLILEFDDGQMIYTAQEVLDTAGKEIERPQDEKTISREAFMDMVNKRMEMMKRN